MTCKARLPDEIDSSTPLKSSAMTGPAFSALAMTDSMGAGT